ncbi:Transposable element Tcb1 transposase, partial [Araneus ventricosus]
MESAKDLAGRVAAAAAEGREKPGVVEKGRQSLHCEACIDVGSSLIEHFL